MKIDFKKLSEYISSKIIEKHSSCLTDPFDNGYLWCLLDLQSHLLKGNFDLNVKKV